MASKKNKTTTNGGKTTQHKSKNDFYFFGTLFVLVIVIISFVVAPLLSSLAPTGKDRIVFGKYGKHEITYAPMDSGNVFKKNVENLLRMMSIDTASMQRQEFKWIMQMAFAQSIPHFAILDMMESSGFKITEDRIDREVAKTMKEYNFTFEDYTLWAKEEKDAFRKEIKETLIQSTFFSDTQTNNFTNKNTLTFLENLASEKRSIQYVSFSFENFPDTKVIDFGKNNKDLFSKISLRRIIVKSEKDASAILKKFNEREFTFEQLVETYLKKPEYETNNPLDYGESIELFSYRVDEIFTAETAEVINTLGGEGVTDPIKTDAGWAIYKIDPIDTTLDIETMEGTLTVRTYLEGHEIGIIEEYINKEAIAFSKSAKTDGFAQAANSLNLEVKVTEPFSVNYGAIDFLDNKLNEDQNMSTVGAGTSAEFYKEIFSLTVGEISTPVVLDGMILVAQVQTIDSATMVDQELLTKYVEDGQRQNFDDSIRSSKLFTDNFESVFQKNYPAQQESPVEEESETGPAPVAE